MTGQEAAWSPRPPDWRLDPAEVHVWRLSLTAPPARAIEWADTLSDEEQARANRFHFDRDRNAYRLTRGALRGLLGSFLRRDPRELRFRRGPHGKPFLLGEALEFNVSHSGGLGLVAIAPDRPVGVDLEAVRDLSHFDGMVRRVLSPTEKARWSQVPEERRLEAFFFAWTQKEAYLKAIGAGLSVSMSDLEVSLDPRQGAELRARAGFPDEAARWGIRAIAPGPGFVGAVAALGQDWRIRLFDMA